MGLQPDQPDLGSSMNSQTTNDFCDLMITRIRWRLRLWLLGSICKGSQVWYQHCLLNDATQCPTLITSDQNKPFVDLCGVFAEFVIILTYMYVRNCLNFTQEDMVIEVSRDKRSVWRHFLLANRHKSVRNLHQESRRSTDWQATQIYNSKQRRASCFEFCWFTSDLLNVNFFNASQCLSTSRNTSARQLLAVGPDFPAWATCSCGCWITAGWQRNLRFNGFQLVCLLLARTTAQLS